MIAVPVAEAVARSLVFGEVPGSPFEHQAGHRLEDQPRIGRELKAPAADRRHLGSADDPQQCFPGQQGQKDPETRGQELLGTRGGTRGGVCHRELARLLNWLPFTSAAGRSF